MTEHHFSRRVGAIFSFLVFVVFLSGCGGGSHQGQPGWTKVDLTDVQPVIGDWEGTVTKAQDILPVGSVLLRIHENGTYQFVGQSSSDVAVGTGHLEAQGGELKGDTEIRVLRLSLFSHRSKPVLIVDAAHRLTGARYHGEFTKAK
ncbi:hypothetical protein W02_02100 [Nitrospira sp. KM1]|uniref:hypothetical protein n=1 Tax=Nitrospira sp. KM1 TaxID=1936990 RepID=UPI0013A74525|nr:hypothetical protein [Nitrospira sp. KM1]BCA53070.1 hypothetical protein W02_02100 [Nitrospira sp. KM1]